MRLAVIVNVHRPGDVIEHRQGPGMGVPTFYRWLHDHYPKCVTDYIEAPASMTDETWPENGNGVEVDNFVRATPTPFNLCRSACLPLLLTHTHPLGATFAVY